MALFTDLFRVYLVKYDLDPSYLVPVDMNIVDPGVKNKVGRKIKYRYFGLMPISLSSNDLMQVSNMIRLFMRS